MLRATSCIGLVLSALVAIPAAAQDTCRASLPAFDPSHAVEALPPAPYYGLRIMGMGGAFTAVAEGAEGIPTSLASLANRRPDQGGYFDWDVALSWVIPANYLDVDNDGCGSPSGLRLIALGGLLRFGRLGVGVFVDSVAFSHGAVGSPVTQVIRPIAGVAYALPGDDFVVGVGLDTVGYSLKSPGEPVIQSVGTTLGADVLWRPEGLPFRVGASLKLPAIAYIDTKAHPTAPPAVIRPGEVSLGGAVWIGDGELNQPMPVTDAAKTHPPAKTGLLLSLDVFFLGDASFNGAPAGGLEGYYEGKLQITAPGTQWGARLGVETEAVPKHVRLRGGLWLEPSRFPGVAPRLHWTGGIDVFLFTMFGYQWRGSFAFDVAVDYLVTSLSVGFW